MVTLAAGQLAACSRPLAHARTETFQPVFPAEQAAIDRQSRVKCSARWGFLFPGLGHLCTGHTAEGGLLAAAGAAELATGLEVARRSPDGFDHPGSAVPLIGFQDLWLYGIVDPVFDGQLARRELYAPQDTTADLIAAPYNVQVLRRPEVWAGILGTLALGVGVSLLVDESSNTDRMGDDPNLFGTTVDRRIGYPVAYGIGTVLFSHVAIAEESMFRGLAQSTMARHSGETVGWINASLLFGAMHAFNIFAMPSEDRRDYLLYGVPFITGIGSYLGWVYRHDDYSLAPSVAIHFWYDFLLTAAFFAMDPENSPISGSISIPF